MRAELTRRAPHLVIRPVDLPSHRPADVLLVKASAAGVTGSGFITLAATLATTGHVPVAGIALILGVDRFMSEARAITNFIGNAVATLVISKWNGDFDETKGGEVLR
mgnify:CR=1 FL=1